MPTVRRTIFSRRFILDAATAGLVLVAGATVVRDRVLPAVAERGRVDPGDTVEPPLRLRTLGRGDTIDVPDGGPALVVVFRSSCPVCEDSAPDWAALARLLPDRVYAIGLEADTAAAAWVAANVPGVRAAAPVKAAEFLDRLRIRAVPTTMLFEGRRLGLSRIGPLLPEDRARIDRALRAGRAVGPAPAHLTPSRRIP